MAIDVVPAEVEPGGGRLFAVGNAADEHKLVLTVKVDAEGVRRFYLNGLELRHMLPEWSINGIGSRRVHFKCTLEVELDPRSDDPKSVTEETVYNSGAVVKKGE